MYCHGVAHFLIQWGDTNVGHQLLIYTNHDIPKGSFSLNALATDIQWGKLMNIKLAKARKQLPQVQMVHL